MEYTVEDRHSGKSKKYEYYYCKSYLYNKGCSKHACQKQQLEQDIVNIINHYKEIIVEMNSKINELNRLLIDELIEDIVVSEDGNIKVIFKYEDKYFEALDFINKQKYDIILSS